MRSDKSLRATTSAAIEPCKLRLRLGLGQGAFASVRLAELQPPPGSQSDPRAVAVKILHRQLHTAQEIELFIREGELLRTLSHGNIVSFIGCSWRRSQRNQSGGASTPLHAFAHGQAAHGGDVQALAAVRYPPAVFFMQEYCAGGSIGELVRRQMVQPFKRLYSDADALRWSLHIAGALQYLHESYPAIMHRDLKLDNVMLTSSDTAVANAKLVDFGLARYGPVDEPEAPGTPCQVELCRSSAGTDLTGRTGSYGYMAPEVLACRPYNASADIFSLGMCMFNIFARRISGFDGLLSCPATADPLEVFAAKVAGGWRPPLPSLVPAAVARVIQACWKGDPCLRASAGTVVQMLQGIQEAGGLADSSPQTPMRGCTGCAVM